MPSVGSDDTLVFELRLPAVLAIVYGGGVAVAVYAALVLPVPWWGRAGLATIVAVYGLHAGLRWWRRMPARLVITGDGRCRGITRDGTHQRYGQIHGGVVRRSYVVVETSGGGRRHLMVTAGMLGAPQFRRLKSRLRVAVSP